SMSVMILLVVLYVPEPLAIATFPTVLLLTSLFRLALNISSSRLILLQADAGEVIRAFGQFVVRGNYVVGAVVFVVLTIVQFVVIAKGAERVAEVGARFVLDAMPGKQMAIDAELRSGSIDAAEARRRRRALSRESQFYGAMDGAMKFVKGDVIASLIITVVNILAGLVIGVSQKGMDVTFAMKRYGLLTIGDGLVSQIPALILATGAGILVTRTASEEPETTLGDELAKQVFGLPKAFRVASVLVLLLAIVPGLPALPFVVIAALFLFWAGKTERDLRDRERANLESAKPSAGVQFVPVVPVWTLELSAAFLPLVESKVRPRLSEIRSEVFHTIGLPLPLPRIRVLSANKSEGSPIATPFVATLYLFDLPAKRFVLDGDVGGEGGLEVLAAGIQGLLLSRSAEILGTNDVQRLIDELEQVSPALVRNVIPKPISLVLLTDVLRRLLEERISIRDMRSVLEPLASVGQERDPLFLSELVRANLKRAITHQWVKDDGGMEVVLIDPLIEDEMRRAVTRTPQGSFLALSPQASRDVLRAFQNVIGPLRGGAGPTVVLTQPDIRRFVRKFLENDLPDVAVTSFAELRPEVNLRPVAKVVPL
ncbi:MAG: FHIPEP family type III secretion protein, partial [Polyangiaceae bacterium]|nr:FHIPEP family type III secretion protein [Polyangiaceae bacterium]